MHRVQKSDAGVGTGMLVCWLVIGITLPENKEIDKFSFHVFDRNEIGIQAFVDFIDGKFMSGHSSSSTFHDFQEFIISNYKNQEFWISENWTPEVSEISNNSKMSILRFP